VHLAYLDDAGTDKHSPIVMCGAVIIFPDMFGHVENLHSAAIQQIIPVDQIEDKFQEFHAAELYNGEGPFEGIDESKRFDAIRVLLMAVQMEKLPYIYAAVDRAKLKTSPMGSANPLDVAFRLCALGIEDWARNMHPQRHGAIQLDFKDLCLFIFDDTEDKQLKKQLRNSYRSLRAARPYIPPNDNRLWHAHDDIYFGDSRDSVGIQMVDLCNYFMWRHLLQKKASGEDFYHMFEAHAICAKPEPEWSTYRELFRTHEGDGCKEVVANANVQTKAAQ
jgi:Protein of unknown function (DUF3800)